MVKEIRELEENILEKVLRSLETREIIHLYFKKNVLEYLLNNGNDGNFLVNLIETIQSIAAATGLPQKNIMKIIFGKDTLRKLFPKISDYKDGYQDLLFLGHRRKNPENGLYKALEKNLEKTKDELNNYITTVLNRVKKDIIKESGIGDEIRKRKGEMKNLERKLYSLEKRATERKIKEELNKLRSPIVKEMNEIEKYFDDVSVSRKLIKYIEKNRVEDSAELSILMKKIKFGDMETPLKREVERIKDRLDYVSASILRYLSLGDKLDENGKNVRKEYSLKELDIPDYEEITKKINELKEELEKLKTKKKEITTYLDERLREILKEISTAYNI